MKIELTVPSSVIEEMLYAQYQLEEPAKLINLEFDELGDICAFTFEVDEDGSRRICRDWDEAVFAESLMEEAI